MRRLGLAAAVVVALAAARCEPQERASASAARAAPASPPAVRPANDLDKAFAAAFGQGPPALRMVNRDGMGRITLRYRPLGLVEIGERTALISGGWTDSCHGCTGALAIHYLARTPQGYRLVGAWPEITEGASFGEPPQWRARSDLFAQTAIEARSGGTWQGCTVGVANLIELTGDRPVVRVRGVLLDYDNSGAGDDDNSVHGELKARDVGRTFEADYTGARRLSVVYVRNGEAYQPERGEPDLPSC